MRPDLFKPFLAMMVAACVLLAPGCARNDSSEDTAKESVVIGKVLAPSTAKASPAGGWVTFAVGDPIDVYVLEIPAITTRVAADGTFTLRGLLAGSFTLVFTQGTPPTEIGRLTFEEVAINQQITISVELSVIEGVVEVVLVDEDRRGIGHAGIELEGPVTSAAPNLTADSTFVIAGRTVIARPGVTAIRKGTTRMTVNDVTVGLQVHVKGTTIEDSTAILAYEIKLQSEAGGGGGDKITICHIPPGNPTKKKTLSISVSAWPAHKAHGDTEGQC